MKNKKQKFSFILSLVLVINLISLATIYAWGTVAEELEKTQSNIISKASDYLIESMNDNGSFGKETDIINETAETVSVLNDFKEFDEIKSVKWLKDNGYKDNNDTMARTIIATKDGELIEELLSSMNNDGGFGLHKNHDSDVLDSVLALEAINSCGSSVYSKEGLKICNYLAQVSNENGSWSYSKDSESDLILTAQAVYSISKFMSNNSYSSKEINDLFNKSKTFFESIGELNFEKSSIDKTLYIQLALMQVDGKIDYKTIVNSLSDIQSKNGSFYDDVHITSLVVKLLNNMDFNKSFRINSMNTALSSENGYLGVDLNVVSRYDISYYSIIDDEYTLKTTVTNGKSVIYENEIPVELSSQDTVVNGISAEFTLNEMRDDGIVVKTELCNSKGVIKSTENTITLQPVPVAGKTELSDFSFNLSDNYTYVGYPIDVSSDYKLLYSTNVENSVDMEFVVTKDGEVVSTDNQTVKLVPESNSFGEKGISFTPDVSEEGKYVVTAKCLYDGKVVVERSAEFNVVKLQQLEDPDEGTDKNNIVVTWAGPVLSDYYVYSGKENKIDVNGEVLYYSTADFTGDISIVVTKDEEIIAGNTERVTLKKGEPAYFDGKASFPIYDTENFMSFIAKEKGKYKVEMKFSDVEGNVLSSDERYVNVVDKPVQDLILNSSVNQEKDNTVDFTWNDISNDSESYNYKLYRRIKGEDWESRSIWNESEKVKVLNVYPYQPYLETWMTTTISNTEKPAGMGLFDIDSVHIATFNNDPDAYLLDENGLWKYDVIFFGSSDCNNGYDLNENSAKLLQKYIDSGRGVLFGHDTICGGSSNILRHWRFNDFAEQLGLVVKTPQPEYWYRTTSASVVNIGTLTNFPWTIRGNLTVPNTHSTGQYLLDATEWITLNAYKRVDEETGAIDNFYLATKNNLGMIQTGDSTGQATDDERKILANTLFYLYQSTSLTDAKDSSFYDVTAPDKAEARLDNPLNGKAELKLKSKDNGTKYEYYISADPTTNSDNDNVKSNVVSETSLSGLNGYVVSVNDKSEPCPDIITYDDTNEFVQNVIKADSNGELSTDIEIPDFGKQYYVHIFAVDNANNVSEETILPIGEAKVLTEISTDKDIYNPEDIVNISANSSTVLFDVDADVNISIFDKNGNLTKEIFSEKSKKLSADEKTMHDFQWEIPKSQVGDYAAKITWTRDDKTLATAECDFNIAPNGKLSNAVHTDKQTYYNSEPVNIYNTILNSSSNSDVKDVNLNVAVYNEKSEEVQSFKYDTTTVQPNGDCSYNDVIKPGELSEGKYLVISEVLNESGIVSKAETTFEVIDTSSVILGKLKIIANEEDEFSQLVQYSVTNESKSDIVDAVVKVDFYQDGNTDLIGSIIRHSSFKAGETIDFSDVLDTKTYKIGNYIGVLSIETSSDKTDLDTDSFEIEKEFVEPDSSSEDISDSSEVIDDSNVTSSTDDSSIDEKIDNSKINDDSDNSKYADSESQNYDDNTPNTGGLTNVSIILIIISLLCGVGLVIIRLMGVNKNEK